MMLRFGAYRHAQRIFLRHPTKFRANLKSGDQFYSDFSILSFIDILRNEQFEKLVNFGYGCFVHVMFV